MKHTVFLGLGSNVGNRMSNLQAAIVAMQPQVQPDGCSPIYETPPWGYEQQPSFLNQVVRAKTELEPKDLLHYLKRLESRLGRKPTIKNGPRKIDLDILFYDDLVLDKDDLRIPHPRLEERAFVLVPLANLAPHLCHPVLDKTVEDLVARIDTSDIKWHAPGECGKIGPDPTNFDVS